MRRSSKLLVVLAAAVTMVLAACGSSGGGGSVTLPSSATRPTTDSTSPDTTKPAATTEPSGPATTRRPPATAAPPTQAEAPTTGAPSAAPTTAAPSESGSTPWWPWLLLGLAVVAGIVAVVLFARSRKKGSPWPADAATAFDQSDEITTHLVGLPPGALSSVASADAARLAALAATVQQLVGSAPDEPSRQAMAALRAPLQSLHAAVDGIALAPAPPSAIAVEQVGAAATALHQATSLARANIIPPARAGT